MGEVVVSRFKWKGAPTSFKVGVFISLLGWVLFGFFFPFVHNHPLLLGFTLGQGLVFLGGIVAGWRIRRGLIALLLLLTLALSIAKFALAMPRSLAGDVRDMLLAIPGGVLLAACLYYLIRRAPGERRRRRPARPGRPSGERIIEMTWTCSSCGHRNLGRHTSCRQCRQPMGEHERYEMPANTAAAVTVTDEALLRMAEAGPNWRCAYCSSDQRALDGTCQECGASAPRGAESEAKPELEPPPRPPRPRPSRLIFVLMPVLSLVTAVLAVVGAGLFQRPLEDWLEGTRRVSATVRETRWEHLVTVSQAATLYGEGFAEQRRSDALEVEVLGRRFHHNERVCAREGTETYLESVPDGTTTESYTERVECGETCTSSTRECSEKCTSNRNGFASCRTVCSGGGRSCTPKYCNERRTRQVPKFRNEQRTRTVCKEHREERRDAEWLRWSYRGWGLVKELRLSGDDSAPRWPTAEQTRIDAPAAETRVEQRGTYKVVLVDAKGERYVEAPRTEEAFRKLPRGSRHRLHFRSGRIEFILPE